jgi:hypothetical protein
MSYCAFRVPFSFTKKIQRGLGITIAHSSGCTALQQLCGVTARNQGAQASSANSFNHSANWPKGTKFRSQPELLFNYIMQHLTCHHITRSVTCGRRAGSSRGKIPCILMTFDSVLHTVCKLYAIDYLRHLLYLPCLLTLDVVNN